MSQPLTSSYWPADRSDEVREITLGGLLREGAAETPGRAALVDGTPGQAEPRTWTYAELLVDSERVARSLLANFQPGERLLALSPNAPEWVILQMACALAGLILVSANPAYRDREIEYVLRSSGAAGVVLADEYRSHSLLKVVTDLAAEIPTLRTVRRFSRWDELMSEGDGGTPLPEVRPDDIAQIQYTGGTTGFPKGVLLTHRGTCNAPRIVLTNAGMEEGDTWINAMPLFHVGGCVTTGIGIVARKGTHVVVPEFNPAVVLELFETQRGNISLLVPTMLIRLLDHPDLPKRDVSSVHTLVSGAAPVPAELIRRTKRTFDCQFTNIFGQTEVSGVVTTTRVDDTPEDQAETIGRPVKHVELKIADVDSGEVQPIGQDGEICARGYQMMVGYLNNPEATAATLDEDAWLHTGDLGSMDERGYVRITGRLKDMIIRGGENISPREVEDVLFELPEVDEVVVLGVPHDEWGEQVVAVVRLYADMPHATPEQMREHCHRRIARFKAPTLWSFVSEYPTTAAGKIQKFALREQIISGQLPVQEALRAATPVVATDAAADRR